MQTMKTVAERLKFARESKDPEWSQAHLAIVAGVSTGTIGMTELGERNSNGKGSIPQIAKALGVRYEWLAHGEEPMVAPPIPPGYQGLTGEDPPPGLIVHKLETVRVAKWKPNDPERLVRQFEALLLKLPEVNRLKAANAAYQAMIPYILDSPTGEQETPGL